MSDVSDGLDTNTRGYSGTGLHRGNALDPRNERWWESGNVKVQVNIVTKRASGGNSRGERRHGARR